MRTMRHLLLKTSKRRALIRTIRIARKPVQGKVNSNTPYRPEARVIPISNAKAYRYVSPFGQGNEVEESNSESPVRIIRLLTSFPQIA